MKTTPSRLWLLLLFPLILLCIGAGCGSPPGPGQSQTREQVVEALKTIGDAAIRLEGTALLQKKAPALLPLIDRPTVVKEEGKPDVVVPADGQVSIAELVAFVRGTDAVNIAVIAAVMLQRSQ